MRAKSLDWQQRLVDFAVAELGKPYVVGETDCHMLAWRALELAFETHPVSSPVTWGSLREALRLREEGIGVSSVLRAAGAVLLASPRACSYGDIVVEPMDPEGDQHFPPVLIGLGPRRYLTSDADSGVYLSDTFAPDAEVWRFE
jgi:hypothetical protein